MPTLFRRKKDLKTDSENLVVALKILLLNVSIDFSSHCFNIH